MKNKTTKHTALRAAGLIALTAIITLTSVSCLSSGSGTVSYIDADDIFEE